MTSWATMVEIIIIMKRKTKHHCYQIVTGLLLTGYHNSLFIVSCFGRNHFRRSAYLTRKNFFPYLPLNIFLNHIYTLHLILYVWIYTKYVQKSLIINIRIYTCGTWMISFFSFIPWYRKCHINCLIKRTSNQLMKIYQTRSNTPYGSWNSCYVRC